MLNVAVSCWKCIFSRSLSGSLYHVRVHSHCSVAWVLPCFFSLISLPASLPPAPSDAFTYVHRSFAQTMYPVAPGLLNWLRVETRSWKRRCRADFCELLGVEELRSSKANRQMRWGFNWSRGSGWISLIIGTEGCLEGEACSLPPLLFYFIFQFQNTGIFFFVKGNLIYHPTQVLLLSQSTPENVPEHGWKKWGAACLRICNAYTLLCTSRHCLAEHRRFPFDVISVSAFSISLLSLGVCLPVTPDQHL